MFIIHEIFKMVMNQISLKSLEFYYCSNISFTIYPGEIDCLRNLSELKCDSDVYPEFSCQISQVCHNLQSLELNIGDFILDELTDLISIQQNLKYFGIIQLLWC